MRVGWGDPAGDLMVGYGPVGAGGRSGRKRNRCGWRCTTVPAIRSSGLSGRMRPDEQSRSGMLPIPTPSSARGYGQGARSADRGGSRARLGVRFDPASGTWRLVATLSDDGVEVSEPVTIGGRVSIVMGRPDGTADAHPRLLWGPNTWWRIVPPDQQTSRGGGLVWAEHHDGSVSFEEMGTLPPAADADAPLMLLLSWASVSPCRSSLPTRMPSVCSSETSRCRSGIGRWGELSRYRVNGIVPDHAMP
jgi:hypothetical protein